MCSSCSSYCSLDSFECLLNRFCLYSVGTFSALGFNDDIVLYDIYIKFTSVSLAPSLAGVFLSVIATATVLVFV